MSKLLANPSTTMRMELLSDGVSFEWESFEDFMKDFERVKKERREFFDRHFSDDDWRLGTSFIERWYGCAGGWKECIEKTLNGWPELRQKLEAMLRDIELDIPQFTSHIATRRRKRMRGDHGDVLDMQRVWSGELDRAWELPAHVERMAYNTKRVTLVFDVTANGSVDAESALWRAALCMLLTDKLAQVGRVFEVWIIDSTAGAFNSDWSSYSDPTVPRNLWAAWCVKRSGDPLVMDRLCSMLNIGFMRTAGFAAIAAGPWEPNPGIGAALNHSLPGSLRARRADGEVVVRVGECYSKKEMIAEYVRAWQEVEKHSQENVHAA